jgi:hypothetical protein
MAILQISKIQQRSGNLVDLPQLDDAEFGWANDARRLFIGKSTPNENIEVLTSYSTISFSQVDGAVGNLNISAVDIADGQLLAYDGTEWVNRGGIAGGLITLGDVGNVKLDGGAIGYVLQTDGLGNLSWTPKGTLVAGILNVSEATTAVVTTLSDNFFTNGAQITIVDPQGMDQLSGNIYYANVLTSTTFGLYSAFDGTTFSGNINSTGYNTYSYTTVSATTVSTNVITVANSSPLTVGSAVRFVGSLSTSNISNTETYYVQSKPNGTSLKIATSADANASNVVPLQTTTGLTAAVYQVGGQAVSTLGSSVTFSPAGGSDTTIQYNELGSLQGSGSFTYDYGNSILTLVGNANVGNLNATGVSTATRFISNIATSTPPLEVISTTRVANLNVSYSNVTDFSVVTNQTTGTFYPVFVSSSATGNRALAANANISFNAATGNLSVTLLNVASNANIGNVGVSGLVTVTGNVTGGNLNTAGIANIGANANVTGNLNVTANANVTANVNANNVIAGNLVSATLLTGTLTTAAQPNITSVGTLTSLAVTGNITAGNLLGIFANGNSNVRIPASNGNVNISATGSANIVVITGTGVNVAGTLNATGNANLQNLGTAQVLATANVTAPQLISNIATGTAPFVVTSTTQVANLNSATAGAATNASALLQNTSTATTVYPTFTTSGANGNSSAVINTSISANLGNASITATTFVGALSGNATTAGTVTTAAQGNITSVGTLSTLGVNGTVTAVSFTANTGIFSGNGSALTNLNASNISSGTLNQDRLANSNVILGSTTLALGTTTTTVAGLSSVTSTTFVGALTGAATTAGTVTTNAQPNITSTGTLTSLTVTGNVAGGNITTGGVVAATGNVTGGNVYANSGIIGAGTILTPILTTGANSNAGTITGNWTLTAGSRMEATYADLAEYYEADVRYVPGTVLMFGGEKEVTLADDGTSRVAGVVSTNPAYVMNATCPGLLTAVALQGRVPCKVRGKISKGDMLISGGNGFARPNQFPAMGTVIGKALEDFDGYEGVIEVAVGRL